MIDGTLGTGRREGGENKFDLPDIQRRLRRSKEMTPNAETEGKIAKRYQALFDMAPHLPAIAERLVKTCREALREQGIQTEGRLAAYLVGGRTKNEQPIKPSTDFDIVLVSQFPIEFGEGEDEDRKVRLADIEVKSAANAYHSYGEHHLVGTSGVVGIAPLDTFRASKRNADAILLYSEDI